MSTRIAVRLPDSLVAWIDEQVAATGTSRAAVITTALRRYRRQAQARQDAALMRQVPEPLVPEADSIAEWAARAWGG